MTSPMPYRVEQNPETKRWHLFIRQVEIVPASYVGVVSRIKRVDEKVFCAHPSFEDATWSLVA